MFLIIPTRVVERYPPNGIFSVVLGSVLIYQMVLSTLYPGFLLGDTLGWFREQTWDHVPDLLLGLVRSPLRIDMLLFALMMLVFGQYLERRLGLVTTVLAFLVGALGVPYLVTIEVFAPLAYLSPLLGGILVLIGFFYAVAGMEDVRFFYLIIGIPLGVKFGFTETASLVVVLFFHALLWCLYMIWNFAAGVKDPVGIPASLWLIAVPLISATVALGILRVATAWNQFRSRRRP